MSQRRRSDLVSTVVAVHRVGQVVGGALRALLRPGGIARNGAAARAELRMRRQVLAAAGAPAEDDELVAAGRAEFCVGRHEPPTFGACHVPGLAALPQVFRVEGRHHEPQAHSDACAGLGLRLGDLLEGHGGLHLEKLVHVVEDGQAALVVDGLLHLGGRRDGVDVEGLQAQSETAEVLLEPFHEPGGELLVAARELEDGVDRLAHQVVEPRHDGLTQVVLDLQGREHALRADEAVDQQGGLEHLDAVDAVRPQADEAQFGIPEGDGIAGPPLEVGEQLHVDKVDLRPQGARHTPGEAEDLGEDGDVQGRERVPPRPEGVVGLALVEEDGRLALPHGKLGAVLDLARALPGDPVHQFLPRLVEPLQHFQENEIVRPHRLRSCRLDCRETRVRKWKSCNKHAC